MTLNEELQLAWKHHQAGRLKEAEGIYLQVLRHDPNYSPALHLSGMLAHDVGNFTAAVDLFTRAIRINPNVPDFHFQLAFSLEELQRLPESAEAYAAGLKLNPHSVEVQNNLGNVLNQLDRTIEAEAACRAAIALRADIAAPHNNLGNALRRQNRTDEAATAYLEAIRLDPKFIDAHVNLGLARMDQARFMEAADALQTATRLGPLPVSVCVQASNCLGNALTHLGRMDEAVEAFWRAIEADPRACEPRNNLGNALCNQGKFTEAIEAFGIAVRLKNNYPEAHNNLGNALVATGAVDRGIEEYRRALEWNPEYGEAYTNLGNALKDQGLQQEAVDAYRSAVRLRPQSPQVHSNLLYGMHFLPDVDARALFDEHRAYAAVHAEPLKQLIQPHGNDRDPDRKLRIGYVSGDLRNHPVGRFMMAAFAHHDREKFEIVCFADVASTDALTTALRAQTDQWHGALGMGDEELAQLIRKSGIDILIDLAGHTSHNRLPVFARKPAPVQATYLGYPNTTGLTTIDWRLTDARADPPGEADARHTEKLLRLPDTAWCFATGDTSDVAPSPVLSAGHVTFGSFNNFGKVNPFVIALWAKVLSAIPLSRLLLKAPSLRDLGTQQRVRDAFAGRGIDPTRIDALPALVDRNEHLATYGRIDIALDTFPYHGTTTTCEALWMGVPVITLAGRTHVSRVGVSLLNSVGLADCIASDADDFLRIATRLASDILGLAQLRSSLRDRMQQSPLTDGRAFTRHLEVAYREMWRAWATA